MVMSAIALLTLLMITFSFDTSVNKIRIYNQQNKYQARLNAESGMLLAMAKLRIYKEARNIMEKNKDLKNIVSEDQVLGMLAQPFVYPIPIAADANLIQKNAVADFAKGIIMNGSMSVTIAAIKGFLNPNGLRIIQRPSNAAGDSSETEGNDKNDNDEENGAKGDQSKTAPNLYIEQQLLEAMNAALEEKKEHDENFDAIYGEMRPEMLIKELKLYVNSKDSYEEAEKPDIEAIYSNRGTTPKYAPLTSLSEMYLLEGWSDAAIDLIKDRLTVHEAAIIAINDINDKDLKILFPQITPEQSKEFFEYRDGSNDENKSEDERKPHPFKSVDEFKNYMIKIVDAADYDKRIKEFESAGLRLGVAGKLFKVISQGVYENSKYTIEAFIDLPVKPAPPRPTPRPTTDPPPGDDVDGDNPETTPADKGNKPPPPPMELLNPRVIEIKAG
ncbi:MAG: hypothetical protein A2504_07720 [Bdellovibrionales bacterium RIFOXYD12_FULL_39_22]|nr:MAG: hypothetical protein A2385_11045 [Bdellovibrionales bacterium RIFOXYB1_FULL_39_21]OFZ41282.1 MAG: hypothetical protein A2485_00640 [Bdellovibrionales bacterium RIFOXYC12_FULL_39_17]OFZ45068.1 MAG: hypothetical protein A2404_11340 [Bdellovibrionales bacterium RIFOXYC1_FULL_39_130]OFZ70778.1 MAG: hypothetical protein A2451_02390 [Bdellovibrionales bacterium RIFOXYC2_FULL_39_8]OFZ74452.1 MAG: hypothetical protein A2560_11375 [Bdellovibrionales bacterium RIFOXYD1_FULL_39_84]OFZ92464.1 MAG: